MKFLFFESIENAMSIAYIMSKLSWTENLIKKTDVIFWKISIYISFYICKIFTSFAQIWIFLARMEVKIAKKNDEYQPPNPLLFSHKFVLRPVFLWGVPLIISKKSYIFMITLRSFVRCENLFFLNFFDFSALHISISRRVVQYCD